MPRPQNPHELIYVSNTDVSYPDWIEDVRDRQVFRICGLWEYRLIPGRDDSGISGFANASRLERAHATLHKIGWEDYCVQPRNPITSKGVLNVIKARDGRRGKVSLHSALTILLMLEDFLSEKGSSVDIYAGTDRANLSAPVRIVPFIFDVRQATAETFSDLVEKGVQIRKRAYQDNLDFLDHMCKCEEMFSERTCRIVSEEGGLNSGIENVFKSKKSNGGGYRSVCHHDKLVYPTT